MTKAQAYFAVAGACVLIQIDLFSLTVLCISVVWCGQGLRKRYDKGAMK